jgi:GTP-binding protein
VDGREGLVGADWEIAEWLRIQPKPVLLAVNKCESLKDGLAQAAEFWELGLGEPFAISGIHGNGTGELLDQLLTHFPPTDVEPEAAEPLNVAIVGRPNVGKSSLLNAFLGEERAIVSPISGTTRDAIDTLVTRGDRTYRLIDTAGIRRKKSVQYGPEFFGINRAFKAIARCSVALLVIDTVDGATDQDGKLAERILTEGKACVVVANKWDAIEKDSHTIYEYTEKLRAKLDYLNFAPLIFVSALTGKRVPEILECVDRAAEQHQRRVPTGVLNEALEEALTWYTPPVSRGGRQGKIYYCTQVATAPPTIVLFVNDPARFGDNYRRYIEKQFRKSLGFEGTPLRFLWRGKKEREVDRTLNRAVKV